MRDNAANAILGAARFLIQFGDGHCSRFSAMAVIQLMDKPAQNIQDSFLNNARKEKGVVTIYLLSGVKLTGRIKSFDKYSLVLETNNQEQLIFKHAISTVVIMKSLHHNPPPPVPVSSTGTGAAGSSSEA